MKNVKNLLVIIAIAIIIFNAYLLVTNFRLNREAALLSYTVIDDKVDRKAYESNIKNLKKILEYPQQESISLINSITVSEGRLGFEAEAKTLEEIEKLHSDLRRIYHQKKITVNITKQNEIYKAFFEYSE